MDHKLGVITSTDSIWLTATSGRACYHGSESSGHEAGGEFLDRLSESKFLSKGSA
jgi:hypothetical protein